MLPTLLMPPFCIARHQTECPWPAWSLSPDREPLVTHDRTERPWPAWSLVSRRSTLGSLAALFE